MTKQHEVSGFCYMSFVLLKVAWTLQNPKQNITLEESQSITTSNSLLSLLSILPVWAIPPWVPHGTHGPW